MSEKIDESFETGLILALHALKAALQASPGFRDDILESIVKKVQESGAPTGLDPIKFQQPLSALLGEHTLDESGRLKFPNGEIN